MDPYYHDGSPPTLHDAIRKVAAAQFDRTLSDHQVTAIDASRRADRHV
jgi:cytochrome c peroxidase